MKRTGMMLFTLFAMAVLMGGCPGSSGGGGGDDGTVVPKDNSIMTGHFTMSTLGANNTSSEYWGDYLGLNFDGAGTVDLDADLDGVYGEPGDDDPGQLPYTSRIDNRLSVAGKFVGLVSSGHDFFSISDAVESDDGEVMLAVGIREGTGLGETAFNGNYGAVKFAMNAASGAGKTSLMGLTADGAGNGSYSITAASPDFSVPSNLFGYSVEPDGRVSLTYNSPVKTVDGIIAADGSMLVLGETSGNTVSSIIAVKKGTGKTAASFKGAYITSQFGVYDTGTPDFWASRALATADGAGNVTIKLLQDSSGDSGTFNATYTVADDGAVDVLQGTEHLKGFVSDDGNVFVLVDTDATDNNIMILVGVKKI